MKKLPVLINAKKNGFTLLELMLVLALLASIVTAGLGMYQIQARNFKVDKTALQMQQWLQAGLAFYIDCQVWPADSTKDANILSAMMGQAVFTKAECPALEGKTRMYMPLGSDANGPWSYVDQNGKVIRSSYQIAPVPASRLFSVSTQIGSNTLPLRNSGNMIAGRLPNAVSGVDQNNLVNITAQVNAQGTPSNNSHAFIVDMQNVASGDTSRLSTEKNIVCPAGMHGETFQAISGFFSLTPAEAEPQQSASHQAWITSGESGGKQIPYLNIQGDCSSDNPGLCFTNAGRSNGNIVNQVLLINACFPNTPINTPLKTPLKISTSVRY